MLKEMWFDYKVDEKNRVVICFGIVPVYGKDGHYKGEGILDKAIARCHEGDEFDVEFGKKLAQRKLLIKVVKKQKKAVLEALQEAEKVLADMWKECRSLESEEQRHLKKLDEIKTSKYPKEEN